MRNILSLIVCVFSMHLYGADVVSLTPVSNTSINITATQSNLQIGSITIDDTARTSPKTYTVSVTSRNGGLLNSIAKLNGGTAQTYLKPYSISYSQTTGTSLSPSNPVLNTNVIGTTKTSFFTSTEQNKSIGISGKILFTITGSPAAQLYSGVYSDVLTVSVVKSTGTIVGSYDLNITAMAISDTITINIIPTSVSSNLPLNISQSNLNVGAIQITANCQNGYLLKISSSNSGSLVNMNKSPPVGSTDTISYSLNFSGQPLVLSSAPSTFSSVSNAAMYSSSTFLGNLQMSYTGVSTGTKSSGVYQDILTFTLQSQ